MPWNKDGTRKESAFYLKSGNSPLFKMLGSSPAKDDPHTTTDPPHPAPTEESEVGDVKVPQSHKDLMDEFHREQASDTSKTSKMVKWKQDK